MSIEWFRDLVICIAGIVSAAAVIFITVLVYSFYRRTRPILDSIKSTTATVHGISSCVQDEVARPLAEVVAIVQGVSQGIRAVTQLFNKRKGGSDV